MRLGLILCLFLFSLLPVHAQDRSALWERWDVTIDSLNVEANSFRVAEVQTIRFDGTFRGGERAFLNDTLERINEVTVMQGETPLRRITTCTNPNAWLSPGTYCDFLYDGEYLILYEFLEPVTDSTETVTIEYTVLGALRVYDGGDQLWWTAIPDQRPGEVRASTITLTLPDGYAPREEIDPVETYGAPGEIQVSGTRVVAQAAETIQPDEPFELRAQYPHNPQARKPGWQWAFDRQREEQEWRLAEAERQRLERAQFEREVVPWINVGAIAGMLLFGLGGALVTLTAFMLKGRKPSAGPVPQYLSDPPDLLPAIAGTIIDGETHVRDLVSTLIDLARRGYLVMEESSVREFRFKRTTKPESDLNTYEQEFLEAIFPYSTREERTLDSLRNSFYTYIPTLEADLRRLMTEQGLIEPRWQNLRRGWTTWGQRLLIAGIVPIVITFLFTLESYVINVLWALGFIALLNGAALLLFSRFVSNLTLTRKGAEAAAKTNAFYEYLQNLDQFGDAEKTADRFDEFLPFTVAFGLDRTWIDRFKTLPAQPIPTWYYPVYRGGVFERGYVRDEPHPYSHRTTTNFPGHAAPSTSGGSSTPNISLPQGGGLNLNDLSSGLSTRLSDISNSLTGMLNSAGSALISQPLPPPPEPGFLETLLESSGSDDDSSGWGSGSSRPRSSGYRSSGRWSSGRSFSGGGSRGGGSSGRGRAGFR